MITVKQSYKLTGGPGATSVSYTFGSSSSCAGVTPSSGTVTPGTVVEYTFTFNTEDCFSTQFTLQTQDDVCSTPVSKVINIANPCATLAGTIYNTPSVTNPFIFTIIPTGGTPGYTINWEYTGVFRVISQTTNDDGNVRIEFQPQFIANDSGTVPLPGDTVIRATITDAKGCQQSVSYNYTFCRPTVNSLSVTSHCIDAVAIGEITARNIAVATITATACSGTTIDWDTVDFDYDTTKLHVVTGRTTANQMSVTIYGVRPATLQSHTVTYSVADNYGIRSTTGTINTVLQVCPLVGTGVVSGPVVTPTTSFLLPGEGSSTVKTLALEDIIYSAE